MDNIELLKQYKQLLDEGLITQEEYDVKKQQLLGGIRNEEQQAAPVTGNIGNSGPVSGNVPASGPVPVTPVTGNIPAGGPAPASGSIPAPGAQMGTVPPAGVPGGVPTPPKPKKKTPVIAIIAAAVVLLLIVGGIAISKNKGSDTTNTSSDSGSSDYTTEDSDNSYSSDNSSGSDNSYSSTDDGTGVIQGSWYLDSVVVDGEETKVTGTAASGSLSITGSRWSMTLKTTETTSEAGDFEVVNSTVTDSGNTAYLYRFYSDNLSGRIEAIYSPDQGLLCLSTGEDFDADNMFVFAK